MKRSISKFAVYKQDSSAADMSLTDQLSHFESEASSLSEVSMACVLPTGSLAEEVGYTTFVYNSTSVVLATCTTILYYLLCRGRLGYGTGYCTILYCCR